MAVDKERMAKLSRDPRLVEALKAMGGGGQKPKTRSIYGRG